MIVVVVAIVLHGCQQHGYITAPHQVALNTLADNKEPSRNAMLRLSVREARDSLRGRLERLSPSVTEGQGAAAAAVQEASALLDDVDAALAK